MKNYLALVRKADFIDLYRYGFLRISEFSSTEFSCHVGELSSHNEIFDELTKNANEFDNAFVYIFIHYALEDNESKTLINIEDVQNIYPLDYEAEREFATSFDERMIINAPIWSEAVLKLQKKWAVKSAIKGAKNIWKIFNIQFPIENVQNIVGENIVENVIEGLYSEKRPIGELPLLVYLLRYERHSFYPKNTIGYFMDSVHAFCNYLGKFEQDSIEATNAYGVLAKPKYLEMKYNDIIPSVSKENAFRDFIYKLNHECPNFSYLEVAPLFLYLRKTYSEGINGKYHEFFQQLTHMTSKENLSMAMYLLGIVLGHEKTYDALYETLPLSFFKSRKKTTKQSERTEQFKYRNSIRTRREGKSNDKPVSIVITSKTTSSFNERDDAQVKATSYVTIPSKINSGISSEAIPIIENNSNSSLTQKDLFGERELTFPLFMVKLTKKGTQPKNPKGKDIQKVVNKDEFCEYQLKGYGIYNN